MEDVLGLAFLLDCVDQMAIQRRQLGPGTIQAPAGVEAWQALVDNMVAYVYTGDLQP